jgi:hypothetical protein
MKPNRAYLPLAFAFALIAAVTTSAPLRAQDAGPSRDRLHVVYSFGLRFMGEKLTTDLAIFNFSGSDIVGFPYVDFVFKF